MSTQAKPKVKRRSLILVVAAGMVATILSGFAFTPALSGFTGSIKNTTNTTATGTLLMTETQGATTCLSSASGTVTTSNTGTCPNINTGTCPNINTLSGTLTAVPGTVYTSTVTIKNNGTVPANTFRVVPGACTVSANGSVSGADTAGFCGKIDVTLSDNTYAPYCLLPDQPGACPTPTQANTLSNAVGGLDLAVPLAAGATRTYQFSVMLDPTVATNADQGLIANEATYWTFAS